MSETAPEPIEGVEPPAGMTEFHKEFWDDLTLTYYWRNGPVYSRPYNEEAITYLDHRIDLSLTYLANPAPTSQELATQVKVLSDLAAYSAGTLKRLIVVLGELTGRPL
ncbi:hypothetical protein SEA_CAELUM_48 [Streptomyces phage Caelum]|uniref:Uncharacterized protein n=1 Tax=Streptomyces phage Caelum TaxID=2530160 RepID=A0A481W0K0_9CAUD|nr:hypothetical protein KGG86_gp48 [Streptomyces phage Caelum]QBI99408.1 hypothetical protein SEA_CAELUM_48 [Streptomyces phage Caelum]